MLILHMRTLLRIPWYTHCTHEQEFEGDWGGGTNWGTTVSSSSSSSTDGNTTTAAAAAATGAAASSAGASKHCAPETAVVGAEGAGRVWHDSEEGSDAGDDVISDDGESTEGDAPPDAIRCRSIGCREEVCVMCDDSD
jgi:multimeric flavodoxin WrbA